MIAERDKRIDGAIRRLQRERLEHQKSKKTMAAVEKARLDEVPVGDGGEGGMAPRRGREGWERGTDGGWGDVSSIPSAASRPRPTFDHARTVDDNATALSKWHQHDHLLDTRSCRHP